jgi:hypothetical protein
VVNLRKSLDSNKKGFTEMSNVTIIIGLVALVGCGLGLFGFYSVYGGRKADLTNAKVGQVFNFEYLQPLNGEPERYLAKVIEPVAILDDTRINLMNRRSNYRRNDPNFKRTNHLVTCQTVDGNIRQFYAERVVNCRRPLLAGLIM